MRNWTEPPAYLSEDEVFDRLVLHYLSADRAAFPPTASDDYREPEFASARLYQASIDGRAISGLRIDRSGSISGLVTTVSAGLITCVWDAARTGDPVLTYSAG